MLRYCVYIYIYHMYMSCCMILYCYVGEIFPMGPTSKICSIYLYTSIPSLMLQRGPYETKTPVFAHHLDTVFPLLLVASQCGKSDQQMLYIITAPLYHVYGCYKPSPNSRFWHRVSHIVQCGGPPQL